MNQVIQVLLKVSRVIDVVNGWLGRKLAWLILLAVIVSAVNATVRKVFDTSSNAWLELQWILFSVVFLLCSPWTLLDNEHIRIDIVNNLLPRGVRNTIEVVGHSLFLLPLCIVMIITAYPFMLSSVPAAGDFVKVLGEFTAIFSGNPLYWPYNFVLWVLSFLWIGEQSLNAGGLPQWPAKALVLIAFVLLFFQAISELIKRVAVIRGLIPDPHISQASPLEAEVEHLVDAMEKR